MRLPKSKIPDDGANAELGGPTMMAPESRKSELLRSRMALLFESLKLSRSTEPFAPLQRQ